MTIYKGTWDFSAEPLDKQEEKCYTISEGDMKIILGLFSHQDALENLMKSEEEVLDRLRKMV